MPSCRVAGQGKFRLSNAKLQLPAQIIDQSLTAVATPEDEREADDETETQVGSEGRDSSNDDAEDTAEVSHSLRGEDDSAVEYVDPSGDRVALRLEGGQVNLYINGKLEVLHVERLFRCGRDSVEVHHLLLEVPLGREDLVASAVALFGRRSQAPRLTQCVGVGVDEDVNFGVVRRLTGPRDENFKYINLDSGGATLHLRGRGVSAGAVEPLTLCISAASRRSLERAVTLARDLISDIRQEQRDFSKVARAPRRKVGAPVGAQASEPRRSSVAPAPRGVAVLPSEVCPEPGRWSGAAPGAPAREAGAARRAPSLGVGRPAGPPPRAPETAPATPVEERRRRGLVKFFRGSFGWIVCEEVARMCGGCDVFLHKNDCNGVPWRSDVVSFRLALDATGNPKAVEVRLERLEAEHRA